MFTRKEHSFFNDPYFKIVREEQQYIEVQSVSTGHCWNVFKNQFEPTCKVKLYHKHKLTDQYYHEHRQCRTVAEAVKEIKEHDEYVLEQAKLKKERVVNAPEKMTRHLKVYETSGYKYKPTPTIMLKGDWLRSWGFDAGAELDVVCEGDGRLVIKAVNES